MLFNKDGSIPDQLVCSEKFRDILLNDLTQQKCEKETLCLFSMFSNDLPVVLDQTNLLPKNIGAWLFKNDKLHTVFHWGENS